MDMIYLIHFKDWHTCNRDPDEYNSLKIECVEKSQDEFSKTVFIPK